MKPIIIERFDSLTDFVSVIGNRKPNRVFDGRILHSDKCSYDFTLTESYDDSLLLLLNGYKEGLEKLKATSNTRTPHTSKVQKRLPTTGVVGYVPHIPNAITGIPQSMITTSPVEQKAKVVNILYNVVDHCKVDADRFVEAGRNLLSLIMSLELHSYRVGLKIIMPFCAKSRCQNAFCVVQVKHHRHPINPLKIAYPILHPSYFRRQGFRWLETCPDVTDSGFSNNYGVVMRVLEGCDTIDGRRCFLRENNLLEPGCFYTEFPEAETHTPEKLMEVMGIVKTNLK